METQVINGTIKECTEVKDMKRESFELGNRQMILDPVEEEKYVKVIDDLGLNGQKNLIARQKGKVIPFPMLNDREMRVRRFFAPKESAMEDYQDTMIPYEIMSLIALCKSKDYFTKIIILHEAKDDIDPVVIGVLSTKLLDKNGEPQLDYFKKEIRENKHYLIGRRGHALKPFEEIIQYVKDTRVTVRKERIEGTIAKLQGKLGEVNLDFTKFMDGQSLRENLSIDVERR